VTIGPPYGAVNGFPCLLIGQPCDTLSVLTIWLVESETGRRRW